MQLQQKGGGAENKNGFGDEMSTLEIREVYS